ncbi:Uncharacterised protein [Burkholderia pseudomallei]|nr:Uncharacterised protein [Burkholderia pseudomallei]CAJ8197761.1 Uncharacterised protein [Burkholderia pseudomallei]
MHSPSAAVAQMLAARIPWLDGYPTNVLDVAGTQNAVIDALKVISLVESKQRTLQPASVASTASFQQPMIGSSVTTSDSGVPISVAPPQLGLTVSESPTKLSKKDHDQLQTAWQRLAAYQPFHVLTIVMAESIIEQLSGDHEPDQLKAADQLKLLESVRLFNIADFLATYFDAYFRSGDFIQIEVGKTAFANEAIAAIQKMPGGSKLNTADLSKVLTDACTKSADDSTCLSLGHLGNSGFVSLFGDKVAFGNVQIALDAKVGSPGVKTTTTRPAVTEFGPQLVRIVIEAVSDANGPHPPGVPTSTACVNHLFPAEDSDRPACMTSTSQEDSQWHHMDTVGNAVEAVVTTGVGAAIRGGNIAALNNEAVASVIEATAGVMSRKSLQTLMAACATPSSGPGLSTSGSNATATVAVPVSISVGQYSN